VSPLSRTPNGAIRRTNTTPYGEASDVLALFDQALFEVAIGRYASRAFDACVRAEKQRVTELCEGARLGVSEPAAALTGSRRPGHRFRSRKRELAKSPADGPGGADQRRNAEPQPPQTTKVPAVPRAAGPSRP
jgi:hypothetical protein